MTQKLIVYADQQLNADPTAPPAGYSILFPKTDGKWYIKNSDGTVTAVRTQVDDTGNKLFNYYNF